MAFLQGINQTQTGLAQNLGQLQLDQSLRDRQIKLQFMTNFLERIFAENARKKADARAQTAAQQQQAIAAGAILAGGAVGGLGGTAAPAGGANVQRAGTQALGSSQFGLNPEQLRMLMGQSR